MEIDHVVLAARSREQAVQALSTHGLAVARGRVIPGFGVSNLVVPLGRSSLEIHYPNGEVPDPALPPIAAAQRKALDTFPEPLVPVAWLVGFEDVESLRRLASLNNLSVSDIPEEGPGYPAYTLAGFGPNMVRRWLPALIHWPVPYEERPHALSAPHTSRPTGIVGLDIAGTQEDVEQWCGGLPSGVRVVKGDAGPLRVSIGFDDGVSITLGVR
ncbi:Glyoxalase-like domain-containing protein [Nonomuraea solani]|uniref:Glyoxalase-like domain-containing protein n=1 Tax=Nonomuraea solani TaxID=1144553 RepID=A0A1H6DAA2_9ACTN|nr:VOC family protein [Nonomuraea solani]SEG82160.1 Glyoxalase-like domain-containing protein [Nonomuraea solani]